MSGPCRVDFYVLEDSAQSARALACRLSMMAWEQGHTVMVVTTDEAEANEMDQFMWNHPPERFLPHELTESVNAAPICIGTHQQLRPDSAEVIINLTELPIAQAQRYSRLLELVPATDSERLASRRKFVAYRNLGLEPQSHAMKSGAETR